MSKTTNAHYERFNSEFQMLKFFGKYLPKLDVMASARMVPGVYVYDGKLHTTRHVWQFLTEMEALTGLGIDVKTSTIRFNTYVIFFNQKPKDAAEFVQNSTPVSTASLLTTSLPAEGEGVKQEDPEPTPAPAVDPAPVEDAEPTEPKAGVDVDAIMAEAEALRNDSAKAAAKTALEEFGLKHGASLSRGKTFDGMLEDLKAHLTA
ncbi:hypothetical protein KASHIRA_00680 [Serratia phage vB_SmaM-Kashira]|nr:hypothetical protein KASHIRA_00680 [Serratia phage vB_SmaM-Kashira]